MYIVYCIYSGQAEHKKGNLQLFLEFTPGSHERERGRSRDTARGAASVTVLNGLVQSVGAVRVHQVENGVHLPRLLPAAAALLLACNSIRMMSITHDSSRTLLLSTATIMVAPLE